MSDLIDREQLLRAVTSGAHTTDTILQIELAEAVTPRVVANFSGGIPQGASSDHEVDLYILDYEDTHDQDLSYLILTEHGEAYCNSFVSEIDPDFVKSVVNAPTLNERVDCANCDWFGTEAECAPIKHLLQRVGPGERLPAGECPECGALAHKYK